MSSYAKIKAQAQKASDKKLAGYKAGGAVKKGTTVNVIVQSGRGDAPMGAPIAPGAMPPPPSRSAPPPAPPAPPLPLAAATLGELGAMPGRKAGGRVNMKDGAGSGEGRLQKKRAYGKKAK